MKEIAGLDPILRLELYDSARKQRQKETPKQFIKMKGGFPYAEFKYMLDEMDRLHPLRAELVTTDEFDTKFNAYRIAVRVTDLSTGETRSGVAVHPVIAFDAGTTTEKHVSEIRMLLSNAYKATLTEALRNAYSNFGICGDLYDTGIPEPPSQEQNSTFWEWDKWIDETIIQKGVSINIPIWWEQICREWDQQTEQSANKYLESLKPKIDKLKEKYV